MAIEKNFHIDVHPGEVLQDILVEMGISQAQLARHLGMAQSKINEICRGKRGISAEMALKLSRAFGQSEQLWMGLQDEWELAQVDKTKIRAIKKIRPSTVRLVGRSAA
jgi:addiction module HigA family antidote